MTNPRPTQTEWHQYFESNSLRVLRLPPDTYRLSSDERERIGPSIACFQAGEASEGKFLRRKAEAFARRHDDATYPKIVQHLIREENRHSAYLLHFMKCHRLPQRKKPWTDQLFRVFRNLGGLEISLRVLVTAETLSLAYYRALGESCGSQVLREICERMLEEEIAHIKFQWVSLMRINSERGELTGGLVEAVHTLFTLGTSLVVWWEHRKILRGKFTFAEYLAWIHRKQIRSMIYARRCLPQLFTSVASGRTEGSTVYVSA